MESPTKKEIKKIIKDNIKKDDVMRNLLANAGLIVFKKMVTSFFVGMIVAFIIAYFIN